MPNIRPNPMESLSTLLKVKSPVNVASAPSRRALDVAAGDDWMEPSEGELLDAQNTEGVGMLTSPKGTYQTIRSRESLRNDGMQKLKQTLGMAEIEHGQKMEAVERPLHIKGQYDVAAAKTAAEASADRFEQQQNNIDARQRATQAAIDARQERLFGNQGALQEDRQQHDLTKPRSQSGVTVPATLYKAADDAAKARSGPMAWLGRKVGVGGADERYKQALTNILDRKGVLSDLQNDLAELQKVPGSLDERIAQLGADASALDPYERQWLELHLGQ